MRTAVSCRPALHSQASPGTLHAAQVSWVPHRLGFCLVLCRESSGPTRALWAAPPQRLPSRQRRRALGTWPGVVRWAERAAGLNPEASGRPWGHSGFVG